MVLFLFFPFILFFYFFIFLEGHLFLVFFPGLDSRLRIVASRRGGDDADFGAAAQSAAVILLRSRGRKQGSHQ